MYEWSLRYPKTFDAAELYQNSDAAVAHIKRL